MKSSTPICLSRIAMPRPAKPVPITATGTWAGRLGAVVSGVSVESVVIVLWYSVVPVGTVPYHHGDREKPDPARRPARPARARDARAGTSRAPRARHGRSGGRARV